MLSERRDGAQLRPEGRRVGGRRGQILGLLHVTRQEALGWHHSQSTTARLRPRVHPDRLIENIRQLIAYKIKNDRLIFVTSSKILISRLFFLSKIYSAR
jgi:hypothetical protein